MTSILYLHGFMSSPLSAKAQLTKAYFAKHYPNINIVCPELSNSPSELRTQLVQLLNTEADLRAGGLAVIGSSMGGYLATWLIEQWGGRGVLINPAVRPFELLGDYLGEHSNPYTHKAFTITTNDIDHLHGFYHPQIQRKDSYKVLLQTGDEILDYRQAQAHYCGCDVVIEKGGDHSFMHFDSHLDKIAAFLLQQD